MESFLRDAERILETAAAAAGQESPQYVICVSRTGSIRILTDVTGWSLPALAVEMGAAALYQVQRRGASVQVEGWSYGRKCLLSKDTSQSWWSQGRPAYANIQLLGSSGGSENDREPHVRNS